jgi:hypothetical protein
VDKNFNLSRLTYRDTRTKIEVNARTPRPPPRAAALAGRCVSPYTAHVEPIHPTVSIQIHHTAHLAPSPTPRPGGAPALRFRKCLARSRHTTREYFERALSSALSLSLSAQPPSLASRPRPCQCKVSLPRCLVVCLEPRACLCHRLAKRIASLDSDTEAAPCLFPNTKGRW